MIIFKLKALVFSVVIAGIMGTMGFVNAADLSKAKTLEYVTFKAAEGVSIENLSKVAVAVNDHMSKNYKGFVARQVSLQDDGTWVEVVYWESLEMAKAALDKFLKDPKNAEFLAMVDSKSVKLTYSAIQ